MGRRVERWHLQAMTRRSTGIRVLVVDDSTVFREALANFVAELEGVELAGRASGGQEALELAARTAPEVVFMDLMMPGLGGLAATRALKELSPAPAVVICTSYDDERLRRMALEAGADVFMHKRDLALDAEGLIRTLASMDEEGGRA
jgi:NarL family two-component system response regulator LiaR